MTSKATDLSVGGPVLGAHAALRIFGSNVDPAEVSAILGCEPSLSYQQGDRVSARVAAARKNGMWLLESSLGRECSLNEHISTLLSKLSPELDAWKALTSRFSADVYCTLHVVAENSGLELAVDTLGALVSRGLGLQFDIYVLEDDSKAGAEA